MWTSETPKSSRQLQENFLKASTLREKNRSKNGYGKCAAASRRRQEPCNSVKIRTNWFFAIFLKVTPVDDASKAITEEQHVSCGQCRCRHIPRTGDLHSSPCSGNMADLMRSEEHTSVLQSLMRISYAVFCLKKKKVKDNTHEVTIDK